MEGHELMEIEDQHAASTSSAPATGNHFDPRVLLNPKASNAGSNGTSTENDASKRQNEKSASPASNYTSLIERAHGVAKRSERPSKRTKHDIEDELSEAPPEKKAHFEGGTSGTILGGYIKEKRAEAQDQVITNLPERLAATTGPAQGAGLSAAIDLTGDDDESPTPTNANNADGNDSDVVILSEHNNVNREVCLGKLDRAYVNAFAVPNQRKGGAQGSRSQWPSIKVTFRRAPGQGQTSRIQVYDGIGAHFASLDPKVSSGLAPILDNSSTKLRIDARIEPRARAGGERAGESCSRQFFLLVVLYAPRNQAASIGSYLQKKGITLRVPPKTDANTQYWNPQAPQVAATSRHLPVGAIMPGHNGGSGQTGYVVRTVEEVRNDVFGMFDKLAMTDNLPEKEPNDLVVTKLLSHQKKALFFMTDRESGHIPDASAAEKPSLWKKRTNSKGQVTYYNIITGHEQSSRPEPVLGGILADVMGLGKTLSVLSLMVETMAEAKTWADLEPALSDEPKVKGTLLIAPLSTISNWQDQIKAHLKPKSVRVYIYHGPHRTQDIEALSSYDVVITSYNVASKARSKDEALFQVKWFRVVLDEAHMIRNQQTEQSQAICKLDAHRRWAVTGTPVQNRLDDLGALIKFLRVKPFDEKGGFTSFFLTPFKQADPTIVPKLRVLVDSITIRRLKDKIKLPPRQDLLVKLTFSNEERELYEWFAQDSASRVNAITSGRTKGIGMKAYAQVLKAITRLRLICAHGSELLSEDDMKLTEGMSVGNAIDLGDDDDEDEFKPVLSHKQVYEMFEMLRGADQDRCELCRDRIGAHALDDDRIREDDDDSESSNEASDSDSAENPTLGYMTPCYHLLCPKCFPTFRRDCQEGATTDNYMDCPLCTQYVKVSFFDMKKVDIRNSERAQEEMRNNPKLAKQLSKYGGPHTKTKKLLGHLMEDKAWSEAHPEERPIKSVIFSGWTSHLDLIEIALRNNNPPLSSVRLDGSMSRRKRADAITALRKDPATTIMLISITAGGLGLNLTTASRVYVMEPQFNPAAEAQAVERVHRLGQEREVIIRRFIMDGSFEEKMLELQRKKEKLAELSMSREGVGKGKAGKEEDSRRKLEELRSLFR